MCSHVRLFVIPRTVACQAPLFMEFFRQEYWRGLPFPSPGDLPDPGIQPECPVLQADPLPPSHLGSHYFSVIQVVFFFFFNLFHCGKNTTCDLPTCQNISVISSSGAVPVTSGIHPSRTRQVSHLLMSNLPPQPCAFQVI